MVKVDDPVILVPEESILIPSITGANHQRLSRDINRSIVDKATIPTPHIDSTVVGGITDVHVTSVIKRTGLINMYSILVVIEDKLTAVIEDGVVINFQHTCVIAATATTEAPGSFVIDPGITG